MALAAAASVLWGLAFVFTELALQSFSAAQLTVVRFAIACVPALFLPRPALGWGVLLAAGLTLFAGQFLLLFLAFEQGMPPGLAAVTQQMQAFFTVVLAALFLRDAPTARQWTGMAVALAGLALIALSTGADVTALALGLALAAALSWAIGNVIVKRIGPVPMFPLMAWLSLVPPLPALLLSFLFDERPCFTCAIVAASWTSLAAALYLGAVATVLAYALWGALLARYPSALVAPFALLAPCAGVAASVFVFGERFGAARLCGMALILAGLAVALVKWNSGSDPDPESGGR